LLKIWNMNKFTGVLGVYNCQGAAWSSVEKKNIFHQTGTEALTCGIKGSDVHLISEAATDPEWNGDCAVYRHASGELVLLPNAAALPVSLKVLEHDTLTVSPIKVSELPGVSNCFCSFQPDWGTCNTKLAIF
jgi:raffinose synthase